MSTNASAQFQWNSAIQATYGTPEIALSHGQGLEVFDVEGKRYLDFLGGIATNVLGHNHPRIVKAVTEQISTLSHVSNFYAHPQVITLAEKLQKLTGDTYARTFFCNSGAEANEAALKISRMTGRTKIVAAQGAFHGRTMGALSLTGQPAKRDPFKPLIKGIRHVPFGDSKALRKATSRKTAMVILEPIMGEAGVIVPPTDYLREAREICDEAGALLVIDAVQTGMGRTGDWFGYEESGISPDVITLAKGLGGGLPLGAMIALGKAATLLTPGSHGSTFGGNPICAAAGNAVIDEILERNYLQTNRYHGNDLIQKISTIKNVKGVRGRGLLIGIELVQANAKQIAKSMAHNGFLVNAANDTTIRLAPAYVITPAHISEFIAAFSSVLAHG